MAWTNPSTRASGYVVTAANWNQDVVANTEFLARPPSAKAARDVAQSINSAAWTAIQFDTEQWDTDTIWSSTANEKFNINTNGKYLVTFDASFAASSGGTFRGIEIQVDSTSDTVTNEGARSLYVSADLTNTVVSLSVSDVFNLTSTQFVSFLMIHDRGSALNTSTDLLVRPKASVTWISS